jgi:hypothetical protein
MTKNRSQFEDMKHIDETTLELFALRSPEIDAQRSPIEQHLRECAGCRELYDAIASFYVDVRDDLTSTENLPAVRKVDLPMPNRVGLEQYHDIAGGEMISSAPFRAARWVVRHPYAAAGGSAVGLGLIAALSILALLPKNATPKDINPTHADFQGEMMLVKNKYGETIDEIKIGAQEVSRSKSGVRQVTDFQDVDGDGVNDVLWIEDPPTGIAASSIVSCKSLSKGRVLWADTLTRKVGFPLQPQIQSVDWHASWLRGGDFENDGKMEVYVLTDHFGFFSNVLLKLDAKSGKELGSYLNPGGLGDINIFDIVSEGRNEIILAGTNNAFDEACIVILDPRFITGHAPTQGDYVVQGIPPGLERAYIRIPRTLLAGAVTGRVRWNSAGIESFNPREKSFTVRIVDLNANDSNGQAISASYYVSFNERLEPTVVNTGDDWDAIARKLYKEHRIPFMPDQRYLETFVKKIQYWDGDNWTHQPTLNKRYVEALKNLKQPA